MKRILLLTENILVEESFQKKLNMLNLEVLTSSTFVEEIANNQLSKKLLHYFQIAILSETITEEKADRVSAILKKSNVDVIRKFRQIPNKELEKKYTCGVQQNWITNDATIESIRDRLSYSSSTIPESIHLGIKEKAEEKRIRLTKRERKLLEKFCLEEGEILSREELCHFIWKDNEITESRLSALSSLIHRISRKYQQLGIQQSINTHWGRGYSCEEDFAALLRSGEYLF